MPGGAHGVGGMAIKQSLQRRAADSKAVTAMRPRAGNGGAAGNEPAERAVSVASEDGELPDWIRLKPEGLGPRGYPVPIEVVRINLLQLQSIDQMAQTFMTRLFIQLRIPHGGMDSDLVRDLDQPDPQFPADTLRPGAMWFLKQLDFPTSLDYSILTEKVVKLKTHLDLVLKVSGTFFEQMELADFPFDVQRLTVTVRSARRRPGMHRRSHASKAADRAATAYAASSRSRAYSLAAEWHLVTLPVAHACAAGHQHGHRRHRARRLQRHGLGAQRGALH